MAPISALRYFPSLDKCLSREELLISWRSVSSALSSQQKLESSHMRVLETFLSDENVLRILTDPFNAYPKPSAQSKNEFDRKTSAINVTPTNSEYDIKEIKEDALWLSASAGIDEVLALRVVVEEYQSRAAAQLRGPFSEEELISIRDAAGGSKYSRSIPTALMSQGLEAQDIQQVFDLQDSRRRRIFCGYLSERKSMLNCVVKLLSDGIELSPNGTEPVRKNTWLPESAIQASIDMFLDDSNSCLLRCISSITENLQKIETDCGLFEAVEGQEDVEITWTCSQIAEVTHSMEIMWQLLPYANVVPASSVVLAWFRFQQNASFLNNFPSHEPAIQTLLPPMQAITIMVSMSILSSHSVEEKLNQGTDKVSTAEPDTEPYCSNTNTLAELNTIMLHAADAGYFTAGPVILTWCLILSCMDNNVQQRVAEQLPLPESSEQEETERIKRPLHPHRDVLEEIRSSIDDNILEHLSMCAISSCRTLETLAALSSQLGTTSRSFFSPTVCAEMRIIILSLIKDILPILQYSTELVEAAISAITGGQDYWDMVDSTPLPYVEDPIHLILEEDALFLPLLQQAQDRYPYESMTFLTFIRAVSTQLFHPNQRRSALTILERMPSFSYCLPLGFSNYETTQEEENNNTILLTSPVQLFQSRSTNAWSRAPSSSLVKVDDSFILPTNTIGRIADESSPKVACWFHEYSGLKYFGKLLETFIAGSDVVDGTTGRPAERESVAEIIGVLATLLHTIVTTGDNDGRSINVAIDMLATASSGLSRHRDVTSVVFDIFEEELQSQSSRSGANVPLEILVNCVHFIHALLPIFPGRVWPLLTRCGLLDIGRGRGRLPGIVESVELISGRYELLYSCCRLFESLVDDLASSAIRRRSESHPVKSKSVTLGSRGAATAQRHVSTEIPDQILANILLAFTRYLLETLESSCTWKFASQDDRRQLHRVIGATFDKMLRYAYGIESSAELDEKDEPHSEQALVPFSLSRKREKKTKIMEALMPSALYMVEIFLSPSSGALSFQPILRTFFDGLETPDFTIYPNLVKLWRSHVDAMLSLTKTLLQVSSLIGTSSSRLETQVFKISNLIARLYVADDLYRSNILRLFQALLVNSSRQASEPPSLLGHLGPHTAKNFIRIISDLDKPLERDSSRSTIWHLLSIVVGSRQQWFANYLITGRTPKHSVKQTGVTIADMDKPLLAIAIGTLLQIQDLPPTESLAMLEFVASAQNFWLSSVCNSPYYGEFITSILQYAGKLLPLEQEKTVETQISDCYQTRAAAYVAEILAMHLFNSRQTGAALDIKSMLKNLSYFSRFASAVPKYNDSIHALLRRNFESMYPGCSVQDLKRTTLESFPLGKEFFYDLDLADTMLSLDQAWLGARGNGGLRYDFEVANVNLSLVSAQIALFQGWKLLTTELSAITTTEPALQSLLANVAVDCMIANGRNQPPEEIFSTLSQTRSDLALTLGQRLFHAKSSVPEMKKLLPAVWKTICILRGNFERSVPEGDVAYYRSLLRLLYLAIRAYAGASPENLSASTRISDTSAIIPTILDILKHVVSIGFREIASNVHDPETDSSPHDLAILTGILQASLRIPGIELCHPQIVSLLVSNSTASYAIKLFSWSVSLAIDGDPIYGEQSILFLLTLCSMPSMAEQLAIGGLLSQLFSADIISYYRRPGVSPFAESTGLQRCYSIWTRGILPLLLKLLDGVQAPIAAEVAQFLNQFPLMLAASEQALDAPETSRIMSRGQPKYITSMICSEVHSTALITFILKGFREAMVATMDIPEVKWDAPGVLENAEFWLSSRGLLREKIVPMGESEAEMVRGKRWEVGGLEEKVVRELVGIRDVLSADS